MRSEKPGKATSAVEVTHISEHGFWLLMPAGEVFLAFKTFPWFREANIAQLQSVRLLHSQHVCWPDLDIDLDIDSTCHPEGYPLGSVARSGSKGPRSVGAGRVSETPTGRRRKSRRRSP